MSVPPVESLWKLNDVQALLRKQNDDGSWRYRAVRRTSLRSGENYDQLETYRIIGQLVEKSGMTRAHPAVQRAAECLFSFQTDEGDFRGIYGTQYTPHYTAGIMELLIKAGYANDERIARGFAWLLSMRQRDVDGLIKALGYEKDWEVRRDAAIEFGSDQTRSMPL
jgi:hypothetical protein